MGTATSMGRVGIATVMLVMVVIAQHTCMQKLMLTVMTTVTMKNVDVALHIPMMRAVRMNVVTKNAVGTEDTVHTGHTEDMEDMEDMDILMPDILMVDMAMRAVMHMVMVTVMADTRQFLRTTLPK